MIGISAELVVIAVVVPALLMLVHWLPWARLFGWRLPPRVISYVYGVLAVLLPVSWVVVRGALSGGQALALLWAGFVAAGAVTALNHILRAFIGMWDRLVRLQARAEASSGE